MQVKNAMPNARVLIGAVLWLLVIGEAALFFLWFTIYPHPSIRIAGVILGVSLSGLTLFNPQFIMKWRPESNKSETVVRMESMLYLAFVVLLALGDRVPLKSAVGALQVITGVYGIIIVFIRRRSRKLGRFIGGIIYMSAVIWLGITDLFFVDLTQLAGRLLFFSGVAALMIAAVVNMKPEESMPERAPGGVERSRGNAILTPSLGWPTYIPRHRCRNRR